MKKALLVSCFGWYQNRLKTVREVLAEEGFEVTVLLSDFLHEVKAPVKVRLEECTYLHVPPYKKNLSPQRIFLILQSFSSLFPERMWRRRCRSCGS